MTQHDIEDLILELLAEDAKRHPDDLREELAARGATLPIDSLLAAEILARIEDRLGVTIPATAESAASLLSVTAFAKAILRLIEQQAHGASESA